ncbi:MAG: acetyl-CoA acetyltransferase [Acidobacteria bacterium RIFCSPLOWO2_12_FULL_60_22]|nr:MAG: acetyl-CoA acetyltransferase [Acidobacteria bacterium RIFCSPLOWO2_12_FULL_60_22]
MEQPVILSAVRTAIGKFMGSLSPLSATQLGAIVVREAIARAGLEPAQVDEVIMGNVIQAGLGQNPARQAALGAGLPPKVAAMTVNKVCGSGLKSVGLAAQAIQVGDNEIVVAGGMESMTNAPHLLPKAREGFRLGDAKMLDAVVKDGLWDAYEDYHMGCTGEVVAEKYQVTREEQDEYALNSHRKAVAAMAACRFESQIVPVPIPQRKGAPVLFQKDEGPRADSSLEALRKLKAVFKENGTVTAGNASGMNDGAAALVVTSERVAGRLGKQPVARIVGQAVSGIEPALVMMAPVEAVEKLLKKLNWDRDEVDLYELNEAFSVQSVALIRELKLNPEKVNVNGGAVALGHPIGASGARVLVTLLHEMMARNARRGIAALCLGGGNAVALAVER